MPTLSQQAADLASLEILKTWLTQNKPEVITQIEDTIGEICGSTGKIAAAALTACQAMKKEIEVKAEVEEGLRKEVVGLKGRLEREVDISRVEGREGRGEGEV